MKTRQSYQHGSLRKIRRKKGPAVWEFRYRDNGEFGRREKQLTLSTADFPTETQVRRHLEALLWRINADSPRCLSKELTFGALADLYIEEEHLKAIAALKPGQPNTIGSLRVSTARGYLQIIDNHIRPRWGMAKLSEVRAAQVTAWLKNLSYSSLTKAHIRAVMSRLFKKAMLWELLPLEVSPMSLVEVRGVSKRRKRPTVLTFEQCEALLNLLPQPYQTMALIGLCCGLRVSEILSLRWTDIDFDGLSMHVTRAVVRGIVDEVKTEYSDDELPLDSDFADRLRGWKQQCPPSSEGWIFPSPVTGRPYEPGSIQQKVIRVAGKKLGLRNVGWHTLRHTYRAFLDASGAPVGVQQKLMRHAQVSTTMNVYGNAIMDSKREANTKVVKMVLKNGTKAENVAVVGFCGVNETAPGDGNEQKTNPCNCLAPVAL